MIKRIFFDLDECLLHSSVNTCPDQSCFVHKFDNEPNSTHYTIFRPEAKDIIAFARNLIGADNVYVITTSTHDYAHRMNEAGGFGFAKDHIFTHEDLRAHEWPTAYGGRAYGICQKIADENNVLIDNLPPRENEKKCVFIGIRDMDRYIEVRDYYGVNFPDDPFFKRVTDKLTELNI